MKRIFIKYKDPIGFYTNVILTNHRDLESLKTDFNRMILKLDDKTKAMNAEYVVFACAEFDDDTGVIKVYDHDELIVQFPKVGE